jgi:hypothetical protein
MASFLFRCIAHPRQGLDVVAQGFFECGDELVHAGLGGRGKVLLDPILAHGFTQRVVGHGGALLPAWCGLLLPLQRLAEKGEVFVEEGLGQDGCLTVDGLPAEIGLPCVDGLLGNQIVEAFEKVGRGHVEGIEGANLNVFEIDTEVEVGGQLLKVGHGVDVVALERVAHLGAVGGGGSQGGLDLHDRGGFLGSLVGRVSGQNEHSGHVVYILLTDILEALGVLDVVVAIGKRQAALADFGYLLRGVLFVLADAETIELPGAAFGGEFSDERGQVV